MFSSMFEPLKVKYFSSSKITQHYDLYNKLASLKRVTVDDLYNKLNYVTPVNVAKSNQLKNITPMKST